MRANVGGEERYLRLSMSERQGWYLQQIVSAPIGDAMAAEVQAGQSWRAVLREFAEPTE
jgi:hypothetical protein